MMGERLEELAGDIRRRGLEGLKTSPVVYESLDLHSLSPINVESEIRLSSVPVGFKEQRSLPYLGALVLIYTANSTFMRAVTTESLWRHSDGRDFAEALGVVFGLLTHGNRRYIDLVNTRLWKTGKKHAVSHYPSNHFNLFHQAIMSTLQGAFKTLPIISFTQQGMSESVYDGLVCDSDLQKTDPEVVLISINEVCKAPLDLDYGRVLNATQDAPEETKQMEDNLRIEIEDHEKELARLKRGGNSGECLQTILEEVKALANEEGDFELFSGLETLKVKLALKISDLESRILTLKAKRATLYSQPQIQCRIFHLTTVVCSSPKVSDTYTTYCYRSGNWYKFQDTNVCEVLTHEVQESVERLNTLVPRYLTYSKKPDDFFLPSVFPEAVESQNRKFEKELRDFRDTELILRINSLYFDRMSLIIESYQQYRTASLNNRQDVLKYEMLSFPYFLKLKSEENLSKWVVLDQCVRELDPMERGLCDFDEKSGFVVKLKSQLLVAWKEVPRFLTISLHEKLQLERLLEEFSVAYREFSITFYSLTQLNKGQYISAFSAIRLLLDPGPSESSTYLKIMKDSTKVLALRVTSMLLTQPSSEMLLWVRFLGTLLALFLDPTDIHHRQIVTAVETISKKLGSNELIQELKACFNAQNTYEQPEDLQKLLEDVNQMDAYAWRDDSSLSAQFVEEMRKMKEETLASWVRVHVRLTSTKQLLGDEELEDLILINNRI